MTRKISSEKEYYLIEHSATKTVRELSDELEISKATIRSFFSRHNIPFCKDKKTNKDTGFSGKSKAEREGLFNVNEHENWIA